MEFPQKLYDNSIIETIEKHITKENKMITETIYDIHISIGVEIESKDRKDFERQVYAMIESQIESIKKDALSKWEDDIKGCDIEAETWFDNETITRSI